MLSIRARALLKIQERNSVIHLSSLRVSPIVSFYKLHIDVAVDKEVQLSIPRVQQNNTN